MCLILEKYKIKQGRNKICKYIPVITLGLLFLIYLNTDIYMKQGILYGKYFLPEISIGGCLIVAVIGWMLNHLSEGRQLKYINICVIILGMSVIAWVSKIWYTEYISVYDLHYDAYFYPVYRIARGDTCYVDFDNIYGGYGYLLAPFLREVGTGTIKNFSVIMCCLVFITFNAIFYILYKMCHNKVVSLIGLLACIYYPAIFMIKQQGNAYYLQYMPHRMLFPCIIGALIVKWTNITRDVEKRVWCVIIYILGGISVFWNVETGVVCVIGTTLFFLMWGAIKKKNYRYFLGNMLGAMGSIMGAFVLINVITYMRTTEFITMQTFLFGTKMFAEGFLSYKLDFRDTSISIWMVMIFSECMLAVAIWNFWFYKEENIKYKCIVIAYFCVMLFGLLLYGLLKSSHPHPYNVTPILYYGVMIAAMEIGIVARGGIGKAE